MAKMTTATTTNAGAAGAAELSEALKAGLDGAPCLVCVWASTKQPLAPLLAAMAQAFPKACVVGSSTAGEFTADGDTAGHAVASALTGDFVVEAGIGTGLRAGSEQAIATALAPL